MDGDYLGALDSAYDALGSLIQAFAPCFAAGTPVLTPGGHRPIEEIRPGDWVLSRPEDDPGGPLEPRRVEETFRRDGPLLELRVGGRVIRTTAEHPFYLEGRGWTPACDLVEGDRLGTHDGRWAVVSGASGSGELAAVYNMRVAEYHTYFVGRREWGFSLWAHNSYTKGPNGGKGDAPKATINPQKQAGHVRGTPQNLNRVKQGKPTSTFYGERSGEMATQIANQRGTPVPGRPGVKDYDFGVGVGTGPNGGTQTRVRVHTSPKTGQIHGHPSGPETF